MGKIVGLIPEPQPQPQVKEQDKKPASRPVNKKPVKATKSDK